jgi:RHS repeat-associated protein
MMQPSTSTTALHVCVFACKFTGKERDAESGLDYFGARHYGSSMGRFMSPDWNSEPEAIPYADLRNPQSLNLYAYVGNNPLRMADPDGHDGDDDEEDEGDPQAASTVVAPTAAATAEETGFAIISGPTILLTGAAMGVTMLFPKDLDPGELTPAQQAAYAAQTNAPEAAHKNNARPNTKGKHQAGEARKKKSRERTKGGTAPPRKPPMGPNGKKQKGPWPPRNNMFIPFIRDDEDNTSVTTTQHDNLPPPPPLPPPQTPPQQP